MVLFGEAPVHAGSSCNLCSKSHSSLSAALGMALVFTVKPANCDVIVLYPFIGDQHAKGQYLCRVNVSSKACISRCFQLACDVLLA